MADGRTMADAHDGHHHPDGTMVRLHGVIGHRNDPALRTRLHTLAHAHAVEHLTLAEADAGRRRLRMVTDKGTDCAVSVDHAEDLIDGAVLLLEPARAVVLRVGAAKLWRLRACDAAAAMQLGWHAGNLHWRVRFDGDALLVLLDGPLAEYRARLRPLLDAGMVLDPGLVPDAGLVEDAGDA